MRDRKFAIIGMVVDCNVAIDETFPVAIDPSPKTMVKASSAFLLVAPWAEWWSM